MRDHLKTSTRADPQNASYSWVSLEPLLLIPRDFYIVFLAIFLCHNIVGEEKQTCPGKVHILSLILMCIFSYLKDFCYLYIAETKKAG